MHALYPVLPASSTLAENSAHTAAIHRANLLADAPRATPLILEDFAPTGAWVDDRIDITRATGSHFASKLAGYLWGWQRSPAAQSEGGWVYRTQSQIEADTCLTRCQQESGRRRLRECGFLEEERRGRDNRMYYRLNTSKMAPIEAAKVARIEAAQAENPIPRNNPTEPTKRDEASNRSAVPPHTGLRPGPAPIESSRESAIYSPTVVERDESTSTTEIKEDGSKEGQGMGTIPGETSCFPDLNRHDSIEELRSSSLEAVSPETKALASALMDAGIDTHACALMLIKEHTIEHCRTTLALAPRNKKYREETSKRKRGAMLRAAIVGGYWLDEEKAAPSPAPPREEPRSRTVQAAAPPPPRPAPVQEPENADPELAATWSKVQDRLKEEVAAGRINAPSYRAHLVHLRLVRLDEQREGFRSILLATLAAPSPFTREWVEKRHGDRLRDALAAVLERDKSEVVIEVRGPGK